MLPGGWRCYQAGNKKSWPIGLTTTGQIRRALPRACQTMSACRVIVLTIVSRLALFFYKIFKNKHEKIKIELQLLRESSKKHEQKSKSSSCCCFLLEFLFIVQKTAPARGAVQGLPGILIGCRLRLARHLFLKHFFEGLFSQKSRNLKENGNQNGSHFCSFFVFFCRKANM